MRVDQHTGAFGSRVDVWVAEVQAWASGFGFRCWTSDKVVGYGFASSLTSSVQALNLQSWTLDALV